MKIVTTSNLGLTILLGCTLGMGVIGWYGSQRLADLLSYVLGAAWQTADGAMEGSIELGNQSLYIQKMLRGMPLDEPELQRANRRPPRPCDGWSKASSSMRLRSAP